MGLQVKLNNCKCGEQEKILQTRAGWWTYCPKSRWYNSWKHTKKRQHGWYPH